MAVDGGASYGVGRVAELAELAGVTVRTLHHYGRIGLLEPAGRSASGYRQYTDADLDRLRRILFYRELDFSLEAIATVLADPESSQSAHLRRQRDLLIERITRLTGLVAALDHEMEAHTMGIQLTPEEKFEIFGPNYAPDYESEAQQRWGDTKQWEQSQQRAGTLTKQDWVQVKHDGDELNAAMAAAMTSGVAPDNEQGMELAEAHRASIEMFYACSYLMHRGIGDMYLSDPRFTRTYEDVAPGLARWVRDAIRANANRHTDAAAGS